MSATKTKTTKTRSLDELARGPKSNFQLPLNGCIGRMQIEQESILLFLAKAIYDNRQQIAQAVIKEFNGGLRRSLAEALVMAEQVVISNNEQTDEPGKNGRTPIVDFVLALDTTPLASSEEILITIDKMNFRQRVKEARAARNHPWPAGKSKR